MQYLYFFDEYVDSIKGRKIHFQAQKVKHGVSIEIELNEFISLNEVNSYLNEYINYLKDNLFSKEVELGVVKVKNNELSERDFNNTLINLKSEIRHFQTKYEIAEEKVQRLESENTEYKKELKDNREYILNLLQGVVLKNLPTNSPHAIHLHAKSKIKNKVHTRLKELVSKGKLQNAIDEAYKYTSVENPEISNEIIILNARLNELNMNQRTGITSNENMSLERNKLQNRQR